MRRKKVILRVGIVLDCHGTGNAARITVCRYAAAVRAFQHLAACGTLQAFFGNILKNVGVVHILRVVQHIQKQVHHLYELVVYRTHIREKHGA